MCHTAVTSRRAVVSPPPPSPFPFGRRRENGRGPKRVGSDRGQGMACGVDGRPPLVHSCVTRRRRRTERRPGRFPISPPKEGRTARWGHRVGGRPPHSSDARSPQRCSALAFPLPSRHTAPWVARWETLTPRWPRPHDHARRENASSPPRTSTRAKSRHMGRKG